MATTISATTAPKPASPCPPPANPTPCNCGCHETGHVCTCCQTPCFERPHFFCGQLLADGDLTAEQRYFREKNKLYHRSLHGHGVVCGLRLTCDPNCCGSIRVGDGFAIDDCGNDIVVCEPKSFDVIKALKEKNWLIPDPRHDPCKRDEKDPCKFKQCFYVVICYDEEPCQFTTPFKTQCASGSTSSCEPTRIRETFRMDILKHPPRELDYLQELEERIACCWKVFTEGPLGELLKEFAGRYLNKSPASERDKDSGDFCVLFNRIKVLFLQHLDRCPALYDCRFREKVCALRCDPDTRDDESKTRCVELFQLIRQYAFECILGQAIFQCPSPPKAHCVSLGTVEVEDGKLLRICNCPRKYVLTFSNLVEVFIATIIGGLACEKPKDHEHGKDCKCPCCADFEMNPRDAIAQFFADSNSGRLAATASLQSVRSFLQSLKANFDFTNSLNYPTDIFIGKSPAEVQGLADLLNVMQPQPATQPPSFDPVTAFLSHILRQPRDPLIAYEKDGRVVAVSPAPFESTRRQQKSPAGPIEPPPSPPTTSL
jgi:hypothetical protein